MIKAVREFQSAGKLIDLGYYINADDIAQALLQNKFSFSSFGIRPLMKKLEAFAVQSGLLTEVFTEQIFRTCFILKGNSIQMVKQVYAERLAQVLARYLRMSMLSKRKRFSFETVFSHPSNLDIMREAAAAGYKVYLYFVSTESPEINKYRVAFRVQNKGHNVPEDKIVSRYYRSLNLMHEAAQISYQAFFFDNSDNESPFRLVAHFKKGADGKKEWDEIPTSRVAGWFRKYYGRKD